MSWILTAKVGDKVVCVDNSPLACGHKSGLHKGRVYEIDDIVEGWGRRPDGEVRWEVGLVIVGYKHPNPLNLGHAIGAWRFRPVTPRNTDISFAYEILRKVGKPVTEDA